ncbi:collagen alpha-1(I) chain-like [Heliangelus exortis]|uniref:collagen alpha-1(I) chain-like n=1 Tax=Heliangelus exortis TaxID=472823 RepID=UPI003A8F8108
MQTIGKKDRAATSDPLIELEPVLVPPPPEPPPGTEGREGIGSPSPRSGRFSSGFASTPAIFRPTLHLPPGHPASPRSPHRFRPLQLPRPSGLGLCRLPPPPPPPACQTPAGPAAFVLPNRAGPGGETHGSGGIGGKGRSGFGPSPPGLGKFPSVVRTQPPPAPEGGPARPTCRPGRFPARRAPQHRSRQPFPSARKVPGGSTPLLGLAAPAPGPPELPGKRGKGWRGGNEATIGATAWGLTGARSRAAGLPQAPVSGERSNDRQPSSRGARVPGSTLLRQRRLLLLLLPSATARLRDGDEAAPAAAARPRLGASRSGAARAGGAKGPPNPQNRPGDTGTGPGERGVPAPSRPPGATQLRWGLRGSPRARRVPPRTWGEREASPLLTPPTRPPVSLSAPNRLGCGEVRPPAGSPPPPELPETPSSPAGVTGPKGGPGSPGLPGSVCPPPPVKPEPHPQTLGKFEVPERFRYRGRDGGVQGVSAPGKVPPGMGVKVPGSGCPSLPPTPSRRS